LINFGGSKDYSIARFTPALSKLRRVFRKPVFLTEANTAQAGRVRWLRDLEAMLRHRQWIRAVVWSQLPSRAQVHGKGSTGNLAWNVAGDPVAARALRAVALDGSG
jgi:hypothetical protein